MDSLIKQFAGTDWGQVSEAQFVLESKQGAAIPRLVALLERDEYVKLRNTADLIYPGAESYWGYGHILRYDVDWLSVRAGWALEQITFQDFGFSEDSIRESDLLRATARGQVDVPLQEVIAVDIPAEAKEQQRAAAVQRARAWWTQQQGTWHRLPALVDALDSAEPARVLSALHWLRFENSVIDGFTKGVYLEQVYPRVQILAGSTNPEVAAQAAYLVRDYDNDEWWWLSLKEDDLWR
jgi:hypothetical protein